MATVWTVLALGGALGEAAHGRAIVFGLATLLVLLVRPHSARPPARTPSLLCFLVGYASLPAWVWVCWNIGSYVGIPPVSPVPPALGDPLVWLSALLLAPVFEELLYRERLLPALRARLGAPAAVLLSSLLFALPHLEAWSVLTTFAVGLMLGVLMLAGRSVYPCITLHMGLNAGALLCGLPPARWALDVVASALVGSGLLAFALRRQRTADA